VWRFLTTVALSCFVFPVVCPLKYLRIERHLAAKFGTNSAVLLYKSSLQMISSWSGVVCF
jgi:hypothetical protein